MTPEQINAVYEVLVEEAGAPEDRRPNFSNYDFSYGTTWPLKDGLGFGITASERLYLFSYKYPQVTDEARAIIERTNKRLAEVMDVTPTPKKSSK